MFEFIRYGMGQRLTYRHMVILTDDVDTDRLSIGVCTRYVGTDFSFTDMLVLLFNFLPNVFVFVFQPLD